MSFKRTLPLLAMLLAFVAIPAFADDAMPSGVKGEMMTWIKDAEGKLTELADATPDKKYSWRPAKGVRSTGEIYMHVAAANLGLPGFAGVTAPEGFDFDKYEASLTKKEDIQKALKDSFAHMEQGLMNMSDADLDKPTEFFGMKTTYRGTYLLVLSHLHEHLGQSIAYARMNGITPPWTARQDKAIADAKKAAETKAADSK